MTSSNPTRTDDLRDLELLHLLENERMPDRVVGERFGRSRAAVQGFRNRTSAHVRKMGCGCTKPENKDGGLPQRWWRT